MSAIDEEYKDLHTTLKNVVTSNLDITNQITQLADRITSFEERTDNIENNFDVKLAKFTKAIEATIKKKISEQIKLVESALNDIQMDVTSLRKHVTKSIGELPEQ